MGMIYFDPADYINLHPFEVWVPAFYNPHGKPLGNGRPQGRPRPHQWGRTAINPFPTSSPRVLFDPDQMQVGSYPIKYMIDMHRKQIEFELKNEVDTVAVFEALDPYLQSIREHVEAGNEAVRDYASAVLAFRESTYHHYYRFMMRNPAAKQSLYRNRNDSNTLANIIQLTTGEGSLNDLDPLVALAKPPYTVVSIDTKNQLEKAQDPDVTIESAFGLSAHDIINGGDDLDFEAFMNGSRRA